MDNNIINQEEYKKALVEERRRAVKEMKKLDKEIKKDRLKAVVKFIIIVSTIVIVFKYIIGEINITLPSILAPKDNRMYVVRINDNAFQVEIEEFRKTTIIPTMIYLNSENSETYDFGLTTGPIKIKQNERINLTFDAYNCFSTTSEDYRLKCNNQNRSTVLRKEAKEKTNYKLKITQGKKTIYEGKFINEIEKYLEEKGNYYILIEANYKNIKNYVNFSIYII